MRHYKFCTSCYSLCCIKTSLLIDKITNMINWCSEFKEGENGCSIWQIVSFHRPKNQQYQLTRMAAFRNIMTRKRNPGISHDSVEKNLPSAWLVWTIFWNLQMRKMQMAIIDELIQQIKTISCAHQAKRMITQQKSSWYLDHLPECTPLWSSCPNGALYSLKNGSIDELYLVKDITEEQVTVSIKDGTEQLFPLNDVVTTEFGEPIYPYLQYVDSFSNAQQLCTLVKQMSIMPCNS